MASVKSKTENGVTLMTIDGDGGAWSMNLAFRPGVDGVVESVGLDLPDDFYDDDEGDGEREDVGNQYEAAINAVESLTLAHAIAGVDVSSAAYVAGLGETLQKISNTYL
jgi:hypothetical protein